MSGCSSKRCLSRVLEQGPCQDAHQSDAWAGYLNRVHVRMLIKAMLEQGYVLVRPLTLHLVHRFQVIDKESLLLRFRDVTQPHLSAERCGLEHCWCQVKKLLSISVQYLSSHCTAVPCQAIPTFYVPTPHSHCRFKNRFNGPVSVLRIAQPFHTRRYLYLLCTPHSHSPLRTRHTHTRVPHTHTHPYVHATLSDVWVESK